MRLRLIAILQPLVIIFIFTSCSQDRARSISFARESRASRANKNENRDIKISDDLVIELEDRSLPPELRARRSASMKFVRQAESLIESEKKRDVAIQLLEEAISVDPTNPYAFFLLGKAFSKEKRYDEAAAAYSQAATFFKNKPNWLLESYLQMGIAYQKISQNEKSIESFKRALEIDPENSFAQRRIKRLQ